MNLLIYTLIVAVITIVAIWIARESGLDARTNGIVSIVLGLIGIIVIVSRLV